MGSASFGRNPGIGLCREQIAVRAAALGARGVLSTDCQLRRPTHSFKHRAGRNEGFSTPLPVGVQAISSPVTSQTPTLSKSPAPRPHPTTLPATADAATE